MEDQCRNIGTDKIDNKVINKVINRGINRNRAESLRIN